MKRQLQLISFGKNQAKNILDMLEIKTKDAGNLNIILDENGQVAKCEVCKKELSTNNLGNVAKGSKLLFCDNLACFSTYLAKYNY